MTESEILLGLPDFQITDIQKQEGTVLEIEVRKSKCLSCGRQSRQPLPGILRCQRASEAFQKAIYQQHLDGINRSRLGRREHLRAGNSSRVPKGACTGLALGTAMKLRGRGDRSPGAFTWSRIGPSLPNPARAAEVETPCSA